MPGQVPAGELYLVVAHVPVQRVRVARHASRAEEDGLHAVLSRHERKQVNALPSSGSQIKTGKRPGRNGPASPSGSNQQITRRSGSGELQVGEQGRGPGPWREDQPLRLVDGHRRLHADAVSGSSGLPGDDRLLETQLGPRSVARSPWAVIAAAGSMYPLSLRRGRRFRGWDGGGREAATHVFRFE